MESLERTEPESNIAGLELAYHFILLKMRSLSYNGVLSEVRKEKQS